jgi:hypothetical protein
MVRIQFLVGVYILSLLLNVQTGYGATQTPLQGVKVKLGKAISETGREDP